MQSTNDLRILSNIHTDLKMVQNRSQENFSEVIDTVDKLAIGASIRYVEKLGEGRVSQMSTIISEHVT